MACRLPIRAWRGLSSRRDLATIASPSIRPTNETTAAAHPTIVDTNAISEDNIISTVLAPKTPSIRNPFQRYATCITHDFPSMKPVGMISYPDSHLLLPLRKDILHRAVIFEGDRTRQGTASTKWRDDVHGSHRKMRPQKGTGKARVGDRMSPIMRGGGVAFGPTPRDFSTKLPRKIYDLAWRTALSYRYMRGELIVLDGQAEIDYAGPGASRWMREVLQWHRWGRAHGRTLFVADQRAENLRQVLRTGDMGAEARVLGTDEVDIKDLLELGRVVIEKNALQQMFADHSHDLYKKSRMTVHHVS